MSPNYLPGGRSIEATRWGRVKASSMCGSSGRLLAQGSSINLFWTPLKLEHRARERRKWKGGTLGHSTINQRRRAIELSYRRCSTLALENPGEHRPPAEGRAARSGPAGAPPEGIYDHVSRLVLVVHANAIIVAVPSTLGISIATIVGVDAVASENRHLYLREMGAPPVLNFV